MNSVTFPGNLDALSPIRDYVKAAAESAGLEHSAVYNLLLAVDESANGKFASRLTGFIAGDTRKPLPGLTGRGSLGAAHRPRQRRRHHPAGDLALRLRFRLSRALAQQRQRTAARRTE